MSSIQYQNIPIKFPRPDLFGKYFFMPANNVAISFSSQLSNQRNISLGPDFFLEGPLAAKVQASFPICNQFYSGHSFNFASGILSYATGESPIDLTIGAQVFSGCYLDSCSIKIEPFQAATMDVSFSCPEPLTGAPFLGTGSFSAPTGMTRKFAYGHLAEISGGDLFSDSNQSSISYEISCRRTYPRALGRKTSAFLEEVSKKMTINSTNLAAILNETGVASSIAVLLKNNDDELVLGSENIYMSPNSRLNNQDLNIQGGGILGAVVTIEELIL
jgi:hypothetical protein